jgi:hypothetical protein
MSCCCGCGLALAMAEAEEKMRCEAEGRAGRQLAPTPSDMTTAPRATGVRGWESLKAALRHLTGSERPRAVPHIASAA